MSKSTRTKLGRKYDFDFLGNRFPKQQIEPAEPRKLQHFEFDGLTLQAKVSPGQIINPKKLFKREMERRSKEYANS